MNDIVLVKLGGSLITDKEKPYTYNADIVRHLVSDIKEAMKKRPELRLIVGNGGGSFPHYPAKAYNMSIGIQEERQKKGFCLVQDAAAQLNRILVHELLEAELNAVTISPSSMMTASHGRIQSLFMDPLLACLRQEMIPVVFGDIVFDDEDGSHIFSTERIFSELAVKLSEIDVPVRKVIQVGRVAGVLDSHGTVVPLITRKTYSNIEKCISEVKGFDVTGGMKHKIEESLALADRAITTQLISGIEKGTLLQSLLDKDVHGTLIK